MGLLFLLAPVGQFLIAPGMKLLGVYRYVSPMLLIYAPSKKKYDLHNGTSFDYLFLYQTGKSKGYWQNRLLLYYIRGLLAIIDQIHQGNIPEKIVIRGSSYFFSERTAQKFGFTIENTGLFERINIILNYVDLVWMYSLAKSQLSFPRIGNVKTASTTGSILMEHASHLRKFEKILKQKVLE